nr:B403 [uncultured bacterium]
MTMSKLPYLTLSAVAVVAAMPAIVAPSPALAQNGKISEIIVYGTDPCPRSTDDEVVVCARKPEAERFRIPERYRQSGSRQSRESWANRAVAFETYGRTGINSCSPVGPGGFTGCTQQLINQAVKERKEEAAGATPPEE